MKDEVGQECQNTSEHDMKQRFLKSLRPRPLAAVVRSQLRRPLSRKIISGEIGPGSNVRLDANSADELVWTIEK